MALNPFTPTVLTITTVNQAALNHLASQHQTAAFHGPTQPDPDRFFPYNGNAGILNQPKFR